VISPWHFRKIPAVQYCSLSPRTIVIRSADKTLAVLQLHVLTIQKLRRFLNRLSIVDGCEVLREGPMPVFVEELTRQRGKGFFADVCASHTILIVSRNPVG
jgi:hypothetical protein